MSAVLSLLSPQPSAGQVTIDLQVTYQVMEGFGTSSRVWDDPHVSNARRTVIPLEVQREILTKLYAELGLTRVRPVLDGGIELTNDNGDPFSFDWAKFNFEWKRNDAHVEFVKQAMPYGLQVYFLSPILLEKWMTESNPEEYVEWVMAVLLRWRALGVELPFYSVINEPGYRRGGIWSGRWLRKVVKSLGPRMRAAGFETMLVLPDDLNPTEAYKRAREILDDSKARPYVGALAYHLYGVSSEDLARMRELSAMYRIPIWMTEFSDGRYGHYSGALKWSTTVHKLISEYGVSAVDYMWGFFGTQKGERGHALVALNFRHGRYESYELTPAYYLTGQFSRFVRPGHVRVGVSSADRDILVTAYKGPQDLVIVAINAARNQKQARFTLAGSLVPTSLVPVQTSRTKKWETLGAIPTKESSFGMPLPAESVTTLIGGYR